MTRLLYRSFPFIVAGLLLISGAAIAQSEQTTAEKLSIAQPLVREGDFAVKLSDALKLGTVTGETEAESLLSSVGIEPRNGWIADYPMTPDIIGELQMAISEAATAGKLTMEKDAALKAAQDVATGYDLSIRPGPSIEGSSVTPGTNYPDTPVINNYYYDEGPPVVTYYTPPPDYGYMYTWVPYPFWWWSVWYPGYYVLLDFHVSAYGHGHGYGHGEHHGYISNHYHDTRTGTITRIDPANRSRGGVLPSSGGAGLSRPAARSGAQAILNTSQARTRSSTNTGYRGYGARPSAGTSSSVFEHSRNIRLERAASDRGYQNRSNAGRITGGVSGGQAGSRGQAATRGQAVSPSQTVPRGQTVSPGVSRPAGGSGYRGDGGGGYHGAGRR